MSIRDTRGLRRPLAVLAVTFLVVLPWATTTAAIVASTGTAEEAVDVAPAALAPRLEAHVTHLASDELEGRAAGTAEGLEAAAYLAVQFEEFGPQPAGDDGGWTQTLDLMGAALEAPPRLVLPGGPEAPAYGVDWVLVRAGPAVAGAQVATLGDDGSLPGRPADGGAVALFLDIGWREGWTFLSEQDEAISAGVDLVVMAGRPGPGRPRPEPTDVTLTPGRPAVVMLNGAAAEALRTGAVTAVDLDLRTEEPVPAVNVLGMLPGVGTPDRPELAEEVVVFCAHYDHVPPAGAEGDEDVIFNGANDDASGTAYVLELARLYGEGAPPARSLLFIGFTAEEKGLVGSKYFVEHPTLPLERVVACLNFEMVGVPDGALPGPGHLFLTGYDRTNLGPRWQAAGLDVHDDPYPQMSFYSRSDNASFVAKGIVGQTFSCGGTDEHYHKVTDEAARLDYDHMAKGLATVWAASRELADGTVDAVFVEAEPANDEGAGG